MKQGFLLPLLMILWLMTLSPGCARFHKGKRPDYETVAANPQYDHKAAEAEHAKALRLLNREFKGKAPKLEQAESHLQKALVCDVTYGPAHNTLGTLYLRQHKLYMAAWEFEYAAKLMPERYEPLYNLGQAYEAADKLDMAVSYYSQALSLAPHEPAILGSLAKVQLKSGRTVDDVRPLLEKLVFHDQRPDWLEWARDELGRSPVKTASAQSPATTSSSSTSGNSAQGGDSKSKDVPDDSSPSDKKEEAIPRLDQVDPAPPTESPLPPPLATPPGTAANPPPVTGDSAP